MLRALPLLLLPSIAFAAEPPPSADAAEPLPVVSLTLSPIHLFLPVVEVTAEFRALDSLGVAAVAALGSVKLPVEDDGTEHREVRFTYWEAGGQARWYPIGDFDHGMEVGLQILYVGLAGGVTQDGVRYVGGANGIAIGPFLGYKLATDVGFTFDAQLGVQWIGALLSAHSSEGAEASDSKGEAAPILRLNVGWSI